VLVLGRAYGLAFAPYVSLQTRQTLSYEAAGAQREVFGGRIVVLGVEIAIVRSF
jgi:hypothetical protein